MHKKRTEPEAVGNFSSRERRTPETLRKCREWSESAQSLRLSAMVSLWGCAVPETLRNSHERGAQSLRLSAQFIMEVRKTEDVLQLA